MDKDWRNELITKGAAVDAIMERDQYAEPMECVEAIKGLPSAQPEKRTEERTETHACVYQRTETHEWISVSEVMPDEHNRVLILTDDGTIFIGDHNEYWEDDYEFEIDDVIAWMPLPDPWKGEEE